MNIKMPITPMIIGVAVIAVLCTVILHRCNHIAKRNKTITSIQDMKKIVADSTTYWKDRYDVLHAEKYMLEGDMEEMKVIYEEMITKKAQELKVKEKQISGMINFNSRQKVSMDSLVKKYATYDTSIVKGKERDTIKIVQTFPEYINVLDTFGVTQYVKKTGFLKLNREPYIDIVSYNLGTVVSGIQGFKIKDYQAAVKVRPTGSIILYDAKAMPAVGVGIEFKVLKLPVFISVQKGFP